MHNNDLFMGDDQIAHSANQRRVNQTEVNEAVNIYLADIDNAEDAGFIKEILNV